jgi:hypothetical protein
MKNKTLIAFTVSFMLASAAMAQDVSSNQLRKTQNSQKALDRKVKRAVANEAVSTTSAQNVGFMPNIFAKTTQVVYAGPKATLTIDKDLPDVITIGSKLKIFNDRNEEAQVYVTNVNGKSFTVEGLNQAAFGEKLFVFGKEVSDFKPVDYNALSIMAAAENQELKAELEVLKRRMRGAESLADDIRAQQAMIRELSGKMDRTESPAMGKTKGGK